MITRDDVKYIAGLARLELAEEEVDGCQRDLGAIIGYVDQLNTVDTDGVEPTCLMVPEHAARRPDVAAGSLAQAQALANGPKVKDGFFAVPKVIEQ